MANHYKRNRYLTISILHIATLMCQALSSEKSPMFAEPIPNVTVALGRDVNLPCVIENLGTYKVVWIHVGRQMLLSVHKHIVTRISRFSVSNDNHNTWLLHIRSVEQQDRGYYMCQVNTNPMISQVGYLEVIVPPNILDSLSTESTVAVREHQNVTLTCKAEGYPTPKLKWRREDNQPLIIDRRNKSLTYEGEQLNLTKITRTEMGAYLCIASNGVPPTVSKRITVDVEFSPMIWVPNQLVGAPAGTNVTIDCQTEAYPRAISYWMFNDTMVLSTDKYITETIENSYRTRMQLTVRNLQARDFGSYRCISKNSLGETEGSIRLYEFLPPSVAPKATEMRGSANKEGRKSTTPTPTRRQTSTVWPSPYSPYYHPSRTEKPVIREYDRPYEEKKRGRSGGGGGGVAGGGRNTGSSYIIRWSAPQLMVVAVQYILTGPYIPPYLPHPAN